MKACINEDGYLMIQRRNELVPQNCIKGAEFATPKEFCSDDCPLMDEPRKDEETGKWTLSCCTFEIMSDVSFYGSTSKKKIGASE